MDDGPESDDTESLPDLLADALSPVVHPDYDSGSRAGSGSEGGNGDSGQGDGDDHKPERRP
ncbi:hypothetical protein NKCBBBOE_02284 [Pseudarthrobacter sp. MM222]|nr:hypothetical protein NKCBBBOE_02284 [Pseudarthrobacter sp. MM222]